MNKQLPLILILDGDSAVRNSLKFALELEGLRIDGCATPEALWTYPQLAAAQCVIVDGRFTGQQPLDALATVQSAGVTVPIILATSNCTESLRRRALVKGASYVIEKPLLDSTLLEAIRAVVAMPQA